MRIQLPSIKFIKVVILVNFLTILGAVMVHSQEEVEIKQLGKWNENMLDKLIENKPESISGQIEYISAQFIGTPYVANTLTGDKNTPEIFTVNFTGMDCFTYIDYVEAIRLSSTVEEFDVNLKNTRYKDGKVTFHNRNHFFSDWALNNGAHVSDITSQIGSSRAVAVQKTLNLKPDGSTYLPGIPTVQRRIYYIPSSEIDEEIVARLKSGDYIGMYTEMDGLDVSHTGILIKNENGVFLRHASSKKSNSNVVDDDFMVYIKNVPGVVVYRPK